MSESKTDHPLLYDLFYKTRRLARLDYPDDSTLMLARMTRYLEDNGVDPETLREVFIQVSGEVVANEAVEIVDEQ